LEWCLKGDCQTTALLSLLPMHSAVAPSSTYSPVMQAQNNEVHCSWTETSKIVRQSKSSFQVDYLSNFVTEMES
jgi:hypothetical protein